MSDIKIRTARWSTDNSDIRKIREAVFIIEQGVPHELEWDDEDEHSVHFLAHEEGFAVGTARLQKDGRIGRVSVLRDWRGLHIGELLMKAVIAEAERMGIFRQILTAQTYAIPFYERLGFQVSSSEFLDAGIPHIEMVRNSH